jgi:hypothetical protein
MAEGNSRFGEELRRLRSMLVEGEPREVRSYLAQTFTFGSRFAETSVPALGIQFPAAGPGATVATSAWIRSSDQDDPAPFLHRLASRSGRLLQESFGGLP